MARSSAVLLVVAVLALAAAQGALAGGRGVGLRTQATICDSMVSIFVREQPPNPGAFVQCNAMFEKCKQDMDDSCCQDSCAKYIKATRSDLTTGWCLGLYASPDGVCAIAGL